MAHVNKNPDVLQLDQINISNLKDIKIKDVSAGRSQGRRFTVTLNDKVSNELVFRDIFNQVQKIAKKERNFENLKSINGFLEDFKLIDKTAEDNLKIRSSASLRYRINTWVHRALQWGTHSDRIANLEKKINNRIKKLDNEFKILSHMCPGYDKDDLLAKLANKYLKGNNLENAKVTIDQIFDRTRRESFFEKIIPKYDTKQAIELALTSFKKPDDTKRVLNDLKGLYLSKGDGASVLSVDQALNEMNQDTSKNDTSIKGHLKNEREEWLLELGYLARGQLEKAFDEINELSF